MSEGEGSDQLPGPARSAHDFDARYAAGQTPWDIGRPQPAFRALADSGRLVGRVLDVGCGTGEHALMAAGLGLEATGVDASGTALAMARRKAVQQIEPTHLEITIEPGSVHAWLASIVRT